MMRTWEKQNPVKRDNLDENSVAKKILSGSISRAVSFEIHPDANPDSRAQQLRRFQINPERNWGPKSKAAAGNFDDDQKRRRNQGKKRKKNISDSDAKQDPKVQATNN